MKENEVTKVMVQFFSDKYPEVKSGEIRLDNRIKAFAADIVCKKDCQINGRKMRVNELAIECKGDTPTNIRDGIGQALTYKYIYGKKAGLAADYGKKIRPIIRKLPIHGYDCSNGVKVDHFTKPEESFDTEEHIVKYEEHDRLLRRLEETEEELERMKSWYRAPEV